MHAELCDGTLYEESTWQTYVLIPKGAIRYFRGICMMDVLCKIVISLLNRQLTTSIKLHSVLHGFWSGWGTGTADLEVKLLQHLMNMREAFLFKVFLDH